MKKLSLPLLSLLLIASLLASPALAAKSKAKKKSSKKTATKAKAKTTAKSEPAAKAETPVTAAETPVPRNHGVSREKLAVAYNYGKSLYAAKQFDKAKDIFKKIALVATDSDLSANSLYLFSQCAFRTEDYNGCVKGLNILAKRWPHCPVIQGGYVSRFCYFVINQVANLQTNWDYYRFKERTDSDGSPVWKESVPPGFKIKRINFKLGFGLYRVLKIIEPSSAKTAECKTKLDRMLTAPINMVWVDEKAPPDHWGHPGDFRSIFSTNEKKDFSKIICERMFFDWKTEKFFQFVEMHDDVRNLKPRFIASTPESEGTPSGATTVGTAASSDAPPSLTLYRLFAVAGYNPFDDSYTNLIESTPSDLSL